MKIIALANCTANKTATPANDLRAASLKRDSLQLVAREWRKRIKNASERFSVSSLYCGRSFTLTLNAATCYGTSVYVLSAGLGVLNVHDTAPSYSLTVTPNSKDFILAKATDKAVVTASDWWSALTGYNDVASISDLVEQNKSALILCGLSSAYLSMIADELVALPKRDLHRVRIVGPKHCNNIPEPLQPLVMPYDTRLNGLDSEIRGTEFDFAQRALASFIKLVHDDKSICSAADHAKRVRLSLSSKRTPKKSNRKKVTDIVLLQHIRSIKKQASSISAGLRTLRKGRKIACEQNRFSRLWTRLEV